MHRGIPAFVVGLALGAMVGLAVGSAVPASAPAPEVPERADVTPDRTPTRVVRRFRVVDPPSDPAHAARAAHVRLWGRPPVPPAYPADREALEAWLPGLAEMTLEEVDCTVYPCVAVLSSVDGSVPPDGFEAAVQARFPGAWIDRGGESLRGSDRKGAWVTVALLDAPVAHGDLEGRFVRRVVETARHRTRERRLGRLRDAEATP